MIASQYLACICWVSWRAGCAVANVAVFGTKRVCCPQSTDGLQPSPQLVWHHGPIAPPCPALPSSPQLAACISGNDVLQDLAQLTDMIADILWCS